MPTLACFGDSYAGLSLDDLQLLAEEHGFVLDSTLVDPSHTALSWLLNEQQRIYDHVATLPADTIWYMSIGGVDTLNDTPRWQLRQYLNQIIELLGSERILQVGYEWWPFGTGVNARMTPFYEACLELDAQHSGYRLVEMRDVVPAPTFVDPLHLSPADYAVRVEHIWKTRLVYMLT